MAESTGQSGDSRPAGSGLSNQALLLTVGRVPILAAILILGIVLARSLSKEEYGLYQAVTWMAAFLPPLLLLGLAKAVYYFLPQVDRPRAFLVRTLAGTFVLGLVTSAVFYVARGRLPAISAAILFAAFGERLIEPVLVSLSKVRLLAFLLAAAGLILLVAVLLPIGLGLPLEQILFGVLAYFAFQAVALLVVVLRSPATHSSGRPIPSARELLAYGVPIGLGGALSQLSHHLDKVVAWFGVSLAGFAVYKRGAMEIPLLGTIAFTILNVATPELVRRHAAGDLAGFRALFGRASRMIALITLPLLIYFEITAKDFLILLYGDMYAGAAVVFRLYLLLLLLRVVWSQTALESTGAAGRTLLCSLILVAVHAPLALVFISERRPWVPAASMLVGHLVAWWGVGLPLAARSVGTPIRTLVPWGSLLRTALVSLLPAVLLLRIQVAGIQLDPLVDLFGDLDLGLRLLISAVLYFGTTFLFFLLFEVFRPEDRAWLRDLFLRNRRS